MKTRPLERRERLARASAARAERDSDVGIVVICVGVAIFLFAFLIVCVLWYTRLTRSDFLRFPLMVVFAFSAAVVAQGRRMRVRSGERVLAGDERAAIVYLRSFDDDGDEAHSAWRSRVRWSGGWGGTFRTYEEHLARTLRKVGPLVAIGNPTEDLPELGAARVYATDEDWHTTVDELTARAGVVLLQTGDSEGLAWEVDHVVALGAPEHVILGLPPPGKRKRRHRYETFRRRFGARFPQRLPESIGDCQFVYFDADWTPRRLGQRGVPLPEGDAPRDVTLRRLARTFKITWGPRWVRMAVYVLGFFVAFGVGDFLTGDLTSRMRVDDCVRARVPQLQALSPPFATTGSAARNYARAECQALEDKHLLAGGGKLASAAATRLRCERYADALYDYEPADRRGARRRWSQVAIRYCATPAPPDPRRRAAARLRPPGRSPRAVFSSLSQCLSVPSEIPRSLASWRCGLSPSSASRIASRRNSSGHGGLVLGTRTSLSPAYDRKRSSVLENGSSPRRQLALCHDSDGSEPKSRRVQARCRTREIVRADRITTIS